MTRRWRATPTTLFYLCGSYNYAGRGDVKESLSLYTLGHIFEQSITELEYREGELEGRETVAKLSKRKRDGVYYTPEAVVNYLVEQTLGPWFADAKIACDYPGPEEGAPTAAAAAAYIERLKHHPHRRSGLRLGRLSHFGISAAAGGAACGGARHGAGGRRPCPRDRRGANHRRNSSPQHLRRRYQSGVRRDRKARAVAAFGAGVRAAFLARTYHPHRQQPGRRGFLDRTAEDRPGRGARESLRLAHRISRSLARGPGRRFRHRARQSALREAAEPHEGRSGCGDLSDGGARRRHLPERADRKFRSLSALHREGAAAARAGRAHGLHRAKPLDCESSTAKDCAASFAAVVISTAGSISSRTRSSRTSSPTRRCNFIRANRARLFGSRRRRTAKWRISTGPMPSSRFPTKAYRKQTNG